MSEFTKIFKKVNGTQQLKQYLRAHVLLFALAETALLGLSKKSLELVRLAVGNRIYSRLQKKNRKLIEEFVRNHPGQVGKKKHANTIWTIWLQGMDAAPEIVQKCYQSMKDHIQDREIIVITEDNYQNYVTFPDHIMEKYKKGIISKVHFADLLRIELMATHGGTWMDGTVFCSGPLNESNSYLLDADLFLYQTLKPGLTGHCRSISSWLMTASTGNPIILLTRELLHTYWKQHDYAVDYFILHDFFQMAIEAYPDEWRKVMPFSNATPHVLLLRLFEPFDEKIWETLKQMTPFHKLSYKFNQDKATQKGTYYDRLFSA